MKRIVFATVVSILLASAVAACDKFKPPAPMPPLPRIEAAPPGPTVPAPKPQEPGASAVR